MNRFYKIKKNSLLVTGFFLIMFMGLSALAAPFFAPCDPCKINLGNRLLAPSANYPLGTDNLGRCVLSRTLYGTRISLTASLMACLLAMIPGIAFGIAAGLSGRRTAGVLIWLVDVMLAFPA